MVEATRAGAMPRPPRATAWLLLVATAVAVGVTGLAATALVFAQFGSTPPPAPPLFWVGLVMASGLTLASVGLRALRFIFLLRRAEVRVPIRDASIGYLAGFSLLLAPVFLGEIALRAWILGRRGGVPAGVTAVVNLWERWLDALALATISGVLWAWTGQTALAGAALVVPFAFACARPLRAAWLRLITAVVNRVGRTRGSIRVAPLSRLIRTRTWIAVFATSVVAWILPAAAFWLLVRTANEPMAGPQAALSYSSSTLFAGLRLAPGGVVIAGAQLLNDLEAAGGDVAIGALVVLAIRLATTGASTVFGLIFLLLHQRSQLAHASAGQDHFDAIADAYDVQIPEARRQSLLARKTELMRTRLDQAAIGARGIDVGCGQGWYVGRMRALGLDVHGFDASAGQVTLAARHLGDDSLVRVGSALHIPLDDNSIDFAYTINVLHHLSSVDDQRHALAEMLRVVKPGGLIFLHEINTTNVLFRFYMGYVFPSLNCIDEGIERWLLPRELATYTEAAIQELYYFTFFPDFIPERIVGWLRPLEHWLERSSLRPYSAHYMAVLRKPA